MKGCIDDLIHIQIRFDGRSLSDMDGRVCHKHMMAEPVRSAIDRSRSNLPVPAGVDDPDRRDATICNQYFLNLLFHFISFIKAQLNFNIMMQSMPSIIRGSPSLIFIREG